MTVNKKMVVGITGASGAWYAQRLIRLLVAGGYQTHLVVSPLGQRLLQDELGMKGLDPHALLGDQLCEQVAASQLPGMVVHPYRDVGAVIASGSYQHEGMVIIPCSSNSLAAVAQGMAQNLLHRAAAVALKERRRLVLVHREMPISLVEIRNMQRVTEAGGIVCPANPGFYLSPRGIDDLVDFVVGRVLDLLGVPHELHVRWGENQSSSTPRDGGPPGDCSPGG